MKDRLIQKILTFPKLILFFLVGGTVILSSFLEKPGIQIDNSTENIFPEHSPEVKFFQKFRRVFGSDEFLVVVFSLPKDQSVFHPLFLTYLHQLVEQWEKIPYVENVLSLVSLKKPRVKSFRPDAISPKEIFSILQRHLSEKERFNLFQALLEEQILTSSRLPLPLSSIMKVLEKHLSWEEREALLSAFLQKGISKIPLEISEERISQLLLDMLSEKAKRKIYAAIARANFLGKPLSRSEIFQLAYRELSPAAKDRLIRFVIEEALKGLERDLAFWIVPRIPMEKRYKLFEEAVVLHLQGKNVEQGKLLHRAYLSLPLEARKSFWQKLKTLPWEGIEKKFSFSHRELLRIFWEKIEPKKREQILSDILGQISFKDLEVDREVLLEFLFLHIPSKKRENIVKEIFLLLKPSDFSLEVVDYFEQYPPREQEIQTAKEILFRIPPMRGTILPKEGESKTAVILQVRRPKVNPEKALADMVFSVRKSLANTPHPHFPDLEVYLAGSPSIKADILEAIKRDVATFVPITVFIIVVVVYFLFFTFGAVLLPLVVIFVTDIWILGCMAYFGFPLNSLSSLIVSLMFVIGVADVIHLMAKYFDEMEKGRSKTEALHHMLSQLLLPCWITSFTTMVGFASLMVSDVAPIREFGLFATLGVFLAFVFSLLLVSSLALLFPIRRKRVKIQSPGMGWGLKILYQLSRYRLTVIFFAILLFIFSLLGILQMKVETNFLEFFKEDSETRRANALVEKYFAGIAPLEIVFSPKNGSLSDYEVLKRMDRLQTWLLTDPKLKDYVDTVTSVLDFYKFAHMIKLPAVEEMLRPKKLTLRPTLLDASRYRLPETEEAYQMDYKLFQRIVHLYSQLQQGVKKFLAVSLEDPGEKGEWKYARISVRMKAVSSVKLAELVQYIRERVERDYPEDWIRVTGTAALFAEAANSIVESQKSSFFLAIVIIFFTMIVVFRSILVGFLGLIPNLIPIAATFGAMGWLGIPLNSSTSMVASISIGIAVDVAVHFISRFLLELEVQPSVQRAILATFHKSGKPILFTSSILVAGFLVLALASFVPTIQFGILTCITIFTALIAGLVVLPAVMSLVYRKLPKEEKHG